MAKIYKNGEKYYYRDGNKLNSCWIEGDIFWPYYPNNPEYEEHTIESEVDEGKTVSYNRPANWVRVRFVRDIGPRIDSWGEAFDNGEKSTYYVTYLGDEMENIYIGGPGYFPYEGGFTNVRPGCYKYFEKVGNDWVLRDSGC